MKSGLTRLFAKSNSKPPVPLATQSAGRGLIYDLGAGSQSIEGYLRTYKRSGTIFSIVSLLAQSTASPTWHLYKKQVDGRRRYAGSDQGDDQRVEVINHAALSLWNRPNSFHTGFVFREGSNQHLEMTGETFWILDNQGVSFPTSMWYVRPDRMQPVTSAEDYLLGWVYTGPSGEQVPLQLNQVIQEKLPDPENPYRGAGPIGSIMPNIDQQHYATDYQRNLFLNGAEPRGVIQVPQNLSDREWDEFQDRWRESHQGVSRAGRVAVLENGMAWMPAGTTNRDLEYGNLRLANRDELREAFRMHKSMLGTVEDVNRANAETAEEVFATWMVIPRLERRKDTLNHMFLPLFADSESKVEFDYDDPSPVNAEAAIAELDTKSKAAQTLINAGFDPDDVLEVVGLPSMGVIEKATPAPALPPAWVPEVPGAAPEGSELAGAAAREIITLFAKKDTAAKVFAQESTDFPPDAMAWMHHATWAGPVKVPLTHVDPEMPWMDEPDPAHVHDFVQQLQDGKKVPPVLLVKTPGDGKLKLVDGHHRYLASASLQRPVKAYIGTVDSKHGGWETMHVHQFSHQPGQGGGGDVTAQLAELMKNNLRPYTARALPVASMNRKG